MVIPLVLRSGRNICVFQVSRHYLGLCSDPKHVIEKPWQNTAKILKEKTKKNYPKMNNIQINKKYLLKKDKRCRLNGSVFCINMCLR